MGTQPILFVCEIFVFLRYIDFYVGSEKNEYRYIYIYIYIYIYMGYSERRPGDMYNYVILISDVDVFCILRYHSHKISCLSCYSANKKKI